MGALLRQLRPAVVMLGLATVGCGVIYPVAVTVFGQIAFRDAANGSLIRRDGVVVASALIGQPFSGAGYLHPRPSAAGNGWDATSSSGSNLGPTSPDLLRTVEARVAAYRAENGLADATPVPVDAVTASASGLDPHISVANARLQATRVASARQISTPAVLAIIEAATQQRALGFLGDEGVSVVAANLALDRLALDRRDRHSP